MRKQRSRTKAKHTRTRAEQSEIPQPEAMHCPHCGREMSGAVCANVHCPGIRWRAADSKGMNTVELIPMVQRSPAKEGFIGALYTKEIRLVDGYECQGVSASTIAFGPDKKQVMEQITTAVTERAQQYTNRGYKVMLKKVSAA